MGVKEWQNACLLVVLDVFAIVEEPVQDIRVLVDVPAAGGLDVVHFPVIDFKAVDEVVKTELDITASVKSEPFWGNDKEVIVVDFLGLFVELSTVDWVNVPFVVEFLFLEWW